MNSLPGLLVEYFISGVIALMWIVLSFFPDWTQADNTMVFFLLPIIYVLGMFIDVLAYLLTYYPKRWIRNHLLNPRTRDGKRINIFLRIFQPVEKMSYKIQRETLDSNQMKVFIASDYPHLSKELTNRSSRDRICRGMVINALGITVALPQVRMEISLIIALVSVVMWVIFERQSHKYFLSACKVVEFLRSQAHKNPISN